MTLENVSEENAFNILTEQDPEKITTYLEATCVEVTNLCEHNFLAQFFENSCYSKLLNFDIEEVKAYANKYGLNNDIIRDIPSEDVNCYIMQHYNNFLIHDYNFLPKIFHEHNTQALISVGLTLLGVVMTLFYCDPKLHID